MESWNGVINEIMNARRSPDIRKYMYAEETSTCMLSEARDYAMMLYPLNDSYADSFIETSMDKLWNHNPSATVFIKTKHDYTVDDITRTINMLSLNAWNSIREYEMIMTAREHADEHGLSWYSDDDMGTSMSILLNTAYPDHIPERYDVLNAIMQSGKTSFDGRNELFMLYADFSYEGVRNRKQWNDYVKYDNAVKSWLKTNDITVNDWQELETLMNNIPDDAKTDEKMQERLFHESNDSSGCALIEFIIRCNENNDDIFDRYVYDENNGVIPIEHVKHFIHLMSSGYPFEYAYQNMLMEFQPAEN